MPLIKAGQVVSATYLLTHSLTRVLTQVDEEVGKYLNRLSDFLFVAARTACKNENKIEKIWRKSDFQ